MHFLSELVPFLLIVIGVGGDDAAVGAELQPEIFSSREACEEAGSMTIGILEAEHTGMEFRFACVPAPEPDDYRKAYENAR